MDRRHFVATIAGAALPLGAARLAFDQVPAPSALSWLEHRRHSRVRPS